jgi:hypothetical protein
VTLYFEVQSKLIMTFMTIKLRLHWVFLNDIYIAVRNSMFPIVPRTPKRQVRNPTGVTAGSLRRATYTAPRMRSPHRQSSPSPESRV